MKKFFALLAALLLLCTSAFAEDYTVQMDALTMGDGFTFVAPLNWSYRQLTEEETLLNNLFFDPHRYDLSAVGRCRRHLAPQRERHHRCLELRGLCRGPG